MMKKKRRLFDGIRVAGFGLVAVPSLSAALNLGDIEIQSRLGEPLNLLIPVVTSTGDEPGARITVELAPHEAYAAAGLEEIINLRNATLSLEAGAGGRQRIRLRSNERVLEPIVPILLEVRQGRVTIRRSYSVLLDLPGRAPAVRPTAATAAPSTNPSTTALAAAPVASPAAKPVISAPLLSQEPARLAPPALSGERTTVLSGESLGELSQRVRRNPATPLPRMMRKVYAANPQAFDGHPDRMWAGADIRVPLEDPAQAGAIVTAGGISTFALPAPTPGQPTPWYPAGKLSLTLSRLPTAEEIARIAGTRLTQPLSGLASRLSESLGLAQAEVPQLATASASQENVIAVPALPDPAIGIQVDFPIAAAAAAADAVLPNPVESTREPARSSLFARLLPIFLLALAGFVIWIRRATGPTRSTPAAALPKPKLPIVSKAIRRAAAQRVPPREMQAERTILAAAAPAPEPKAQPKAVPMPPSPKPVILQDRATPAPKATEANSPASDAAGLTVLTLKPEPKADPTTAESTEAAESVETEKAAAAPSTKVVAMSGLRRREDPSIEVSERDLPEATGGLTGFYADVAKMLIGALESNPSRSDLRLKLLEVYFAAGMADEFLQQTRIYLEALRGRHDNSWAEVAEMGRQLYPGHEWFLVGTPPVLGNKAVEATTPARNFNRYYEGVDQWKLRGALEDLVQQYKLHSHDPAFLSLRQTLLQQHAGRPSPLIHAAALSSKLGGAQLYLKREPRHGYGHDHLINAIGQVALAKRMGRRQVLTATSNGLHGLAVAIIARAQKLECRVYMDEKDSRANHARVLRIKELGAELEIVRDASNLPEVDARRSALSCWLEDSRQSLFISSLASGPHPYPMIMQDALGLVGREARNQMQAHSQRPPAAIVAGVADGPVVIGLMHAFLEDGQTRLHCAENAAINSAVADRLVGSTMGALREHDWPREHAWLRDTRRVQYGSVTEGESLLAMTLMYEQERLMLSEEGARVIAYASRVAKELTPEHSVVVLLPSQNDADAHFVEQNLGATIRTSAA